MPKKGARKRNRRFRGSQDVSTLHYPVYYVIAAGSSGVTSVSSLGEQFDRARPFRIAGGRCQFSAEKAPTAIYMVAYGPQNTSDSVWSTRVFLIPTGTVRQWTFTVPVTANGWYPSDTLASTYLFQVYANCPIKGWPGRVSGTIELAIQLGPWEPSFNCPSLPLQPPPSEEESESDHSWACLSRSRRSSV